MIKEYTIKQLLDNYTLFVPEIQRDYVWGNKVNFERVMKPFLKSLDENIQSDSIYNVGFLYSYKHTDNDNYIIDGQQRFTSIVLLLYILSVIEGKSSDFDENLQTSHPTTRFSYNVRPQTETFLRRLFASKNITRESIVNQNWYMPNYDNDVTISSMINAVDKMASLLKDLPNLSYHNILHHIGFWYFNVDETSQGEELYITMNSRGQKLTDAEQIKPHLFDQWQKAKPQTCSDADYGKLWDEWEELFYTKKGELSINAVDIAMNAFIRIVYEMETTKECRESVPVRNDVLNLPLIHRYIESMLAFADKEWSQLLTDQKEYRQLRVLKALIAEGLKPVHHDNDRERVKRIFTNIVTRRKYLKSHNDLLMFLHEYALSSSSFYDFVIEHDELSPKIFDEHELSKIRIYKQYSDSPTMQRRIELAFSAAEATLVWRGNIKPLIHWSLENADDLGSFNIEKFEYYASKFASLLADERLKNDKVMDTIRRALLAFGMNNYPRIFSGYTNTSFAYEPEDWHTLFLDEPNLPLMKTFLDEYNGLESLERIINAYPIESDYSEFVHIPELLEYCVQKRIQWRWDTIYLISGANANSAHANIHTYKYYLSRKEAFNYANWTKPEFYPYSNTCFYMDFPPCRIAFDAMWNAGSKNRQMAIEVFLRQDKGKENKDIIKDFLSPIQELRTYVWDNEKGRYVFNFDTPKDEQESFRLMDEKIEQLINFINTTYTR